jgi:hypothetical protein
MKRILKFALALAVPALLAGCPGGSGGSNSSSNDNRPDPSVDFSAFVIDQIENSSNPRQAVTINDKDFSFNDQSNEQAFDVVFL